MMTTGLASNQALVSSSFSVVSTGLPPPPFNTDLVQRITGFLDFFHPVFSGEI
jgi:hypothetical protein